MSNSINTVNATPRKKNASVCPIVFMTTLRQLHDSGKEGKTIPNHIELIRLATICDEYPNGITMDEDSYGPYKNARKKEALTAYIDAEKVALSLDENDARRRPMLRHINTKRMENELLFKMTMTRKGWSNSSAEQKKEALGSLLSGLSLDDYDSEVESEELLSIGE